jgi:hypothetical protein
MTRSIMAPFGKFSKEATRSADYSPDIRISRLASSIPLSWRPAISTTA